MLVKQQYWERECVTEFVDGIDLNEVECGGCPFGFEIGDLSGVGDDRPGALLNSIKQMHSSVEEEEEENDSQESLAFK
ncbi:unnamed protein product [Medioppia subpectinata]|uniref:Uncharacterized protein n=1 Tax=Medioppia subpectinata TaxID=1979941 RepID=A0A7R9KV98_9ACAR|nr:unnamed protein product [Medioppia subpectinata]CAG2110372.1 unnamed protein product [Medioppia subpectinata]